MALINADRVLETSTTTGTGAFDLLGAVTGFQTFSAVCATSDTCYYSIYAVNASGVPSGEWETGLGTYSAASQLTRTTPAESSNAGAAVNFSAGTKYVMIGPIASTIPAVASAADLWTGTNTAKYPTPAVIQAAAVPTALTSSATITPDMNAGANFTLTLAHNATLANPSNLQAGDSGAIEITQDGTGSRTLVYGANWKFPGGAPVLSTAAGSVDLLTYWAPTTGRILATLTKAYSS